MPRRTSRWRRRQNFECPNLIHLVAHMTLRMTHAENELPTTNALCGSAFPLTIQNSKESLRALSRRYGINQKTVAKWKKRTSLADLPTGPKEPHSTVLSIEHEAVIVAFRRHTLLPLDDCLYALQPTIPHLTRSSLHRCLQRHGISRLPDAQGDKELKKKFKSYPIGYFHVDIAEVHTTEGRLYLFVAIDRTSKFAFAQLVGKATRRVAGNFLGALAIAVPYKIHTVLTDNVLCGQAKREQADRSLCISNCRCIHDDCSRWFPPSMGSFPAIANTGSIGMSRRGPHRP